MKISTLRNIRFPEKLLPRIAQAARAEARLVGVPVSINAYIVRACERAVDVTETGVQRRAMASEGGVPHV